MFKTLLQLNLNKQTLLMCGVVVAIVILLVVNSSLLLPVFLELMKPIPAVNETTLIDERVVNEAVKIIMPN